MGGGGPKASKRFLMRFGAIAFVESESIARKRGIQFDAECITMCFCQDGRGSDGFDPRIAFDQVFAGHRKSFHEKRVGEDIVGRDGESFDGTSHGEGAGATDIERVDFLYACLADCPGDGDGFDDLRDRDAPFGGKLFGIPHPFVADAFRKDDGRGNHWPRETAAPRFIDAGHARKACTRKGAFFVLGCACDGGHGSKCTEREEDLPPIWAFRYAKKYRPMSFKIVRISTGILLSLAIAGGLLPASNAYALDLYNPRIRYKDEKMVIENPASKCNTKATRARHVAVLALAEKDGEKYGLNASSTGDLADAYARYLMGLDIVWDAMNEEYCGYGAFGLKAAVKSYEKSVTRLRQRFLTAAKELNAVPVAKEFPLKAVTTGTTAIVK